MYMLGLEKAKEPDIKLPTFFRSQRKPGNSRKTFTSALMTILNPLTVCITTNCGKFTKRWEYQTTYLAPEKPVCRSRRNRTGHETMDWLKIGKGVHHGCILSPCSMQSTSCEMLGWMTHKLESRLLGRNINNLRYTDEELKSLLMKVKEEVKKLA